MCVVNGCQGTPYFYVASIVVNASRHIKDLWNFAKLQIARNACNLREIQSLITKIMLYKVRYMSTHFVRVVVNFLTKHASKY